MNLTGALLITAAALGAGWPKSTDLLLDDLKARQTREMISASAPCQRATERPKNPLIVHSIQIDPKTLVPDLNTMMKKSDEVVLAVYRDHADLLSPSGESAVVYFEVRVIRSWKGSHRAGDVFTFGFPGGFIRCDPLIQSSFWVKPGGNDYDGPPVEIAYFLFLRQSKDQEAQLVDGLRPAAGEGMQGIYAIKAPLETHEQKTCFDARRKSDDLQPCDSYLENNDSPILVPYVHDPLRKIYNGMPASDFLREVQSSAAAQGLTEKSSVR